MSDTPVLYAGDKIHIVSEKMTDLQARRIGDDFKKAGIQVLGWLMSSKIQGYHVASIIRERPTVVRARLVAEPKIHTV